ncbi:MAG: M16 family metallopeptidase [Bacteroidota bacterium]
MKKIFLFLSFSTSLVAGFSQAPDRSGPPALAQVKNLELPVPVRFTLSNGLKVVLMEKHNVPMVQVNLLIQTGNYDDPLGKEGLASFAMDALDEGAGKFSALQLSDEIEYLGAQIGTGSRPFSSEVNCTAPVARLQDALALMSTIILQPAFADSELDRLKKLRLNGLLQNYDDPNAIAQRAFNQLMFTEASPYGRFPNESSIRSYTRADLLNFHKSHFVTGNSTLIIAGDVTRQSIQPLLEKYFTAYPKGNASNKVRPVPAQVKGRTIYVIDKPGAAQSVISIGRLGPARNDPAYYAVNVLNTILGGSFTSRLNSNLREQHGYAYGASSSFSFWNMPSPFVASSSVQTDVTGPALGEFFVEFNKIRQPIPADELTRGKNYNALGYARLFETNSDLAGTLSAQILFQLPDGYYNGYVGKVLSVTGDEVKAAANQFIVPDNLLVVVVGDRAKIEAGIRQLNLGTISLLSIEDVLGKKPVL